GPDGEYLTERLTEEAVRFLQQQAEQPFLLYLPYFSIHTPLQGKAELMEKYETKLAEQRAPQSASFVHRHSSYAAMVEAMDRGVGRVVATLRKLGLLDNTLLIFTSDNGGITSLSSQRPLRAGKGSYYEGGIRIPLVVHWPERVTAGSICHTPVINLDIYPTVLDILRKKPTADSRLDGQSILPLLTQTGTFAERPLYWHFPIYLQQYRGWQDESRDSLFRTRPGSVIRVGDWKLHEYFEDGHLELYNLNWDVSERNNLARQYPDRTLQLHRQLQGWRRQLGARTPTTLNPAYEAAQGATVNN
ncbi:MAG: sulfatase-like hydrolase/transferase, partial [Bacteroidota bacterium]